jgi:hypothetical protein
MLFYKDGIVDELRRFFPNTSFSASGPSDDFLEENNLYRVNTFKQHDQSTQVLVSADPYIEGDWVYTVQVRDMTEEELAAHTASKAAQVRADRNRRLAESDWTQLLDAPVDRTAWATYRQELREVPDQETFPNSIAWPVKPGEQVVVEDSLAE